MAMAETSPETIAGIETAASPALLVFPDRVGRNIDRMVSMVGGRTDRLRPHLKTNKMVEVTRMLLHAGIRKFKCATVAEMEMAIGAGAEDVLLAYQPVGPAVAQLRSLVERFPGTRISVLVDCPEAMQGMAKAFASSERPLSVYVDIDCGMHRTGVAPGPAARDLVRDLQASPTLAFAGLHVYDGHIRDADLEARRAAVERAFENVLAFVDASGSVGESEVSIIAGGTPTYPVHATNERVECSPGTCVFWDRGYACGLPDMEFEWAAWLLTRVVSRPGDDLLCLDLGHKAVAAENPIEKRVWFPALPDAEFVSQSEEHLVVRTAESAEWPVGSPLLGVPWHVCPTVALYDRVLVVRDGGLVGTWDIPARNRGLQSI